MPIRRLMAKPIHVGPYSQAIILPAWWLRMNQNPKCVELTLTLDVIEIRPMPEDSHDESNGSQDN